MKHLIYIGILFCCFNLQAGEISYYEKQGDELRSKLNFKGALLNYEKALSANDEVSIHFKIGECYRKLSDHSAALPHYQKSLELKDSLPEVLFYCAQGLKANKEYEAASAMISQYNEITEGNTLNFNSAENFKALDALNAEYELEKININSGQSDFSPVFFKNGLLFTSNRTLLKMFARTSGIDNMPFTNLYFAPIDKKGNLGKVEVMKGELKGKFNEGPATTSKGYKKIIVNRNNVLEGKATKDSSGISNLKLYTCKEGVDGFELSSEFKYNSDDYSTGHPALSWNGDTLVFTSDMPGGMGGTDLYMCVKNKVDNWSKPINLGRQVNTPGNEMFPNIHRDGTLYYSSDGHLGFGGLDIFECKKKNGNWNIAFNMGKVVNSSSDDFGLVFDKKKSYGYFTSNRDGGKGADDIYRIKVKDPEFNPCDTMVAVQQCVTLYEENTLDLQLQGFGYEWVLGDGNKKKGLIVDHCYADAGVYEVSLNVIDSITGAVLFNEATYQLEIRREDQLVIEGPDTVLINSEVDFKGSAAYLKQCNADEYFWKIGSDGKVFNGKEVSYTFKEAGTYPVRLLAKGRDSESPMMCEKCNLKMITVLDHEEYGKYKTKRDDNPYAKK